MRKLLFIASYFIFFQLNLLDAKIENKILVKIDDGIITTFDVQNETKIFLFLNGIEPTKKNILDIKNKMLKVLINRELKRGEIKRYNVKDFNEMDLNSYIQRIAKNKNLNVQELKNSFERNNLNFNNFIDNIEVDFIWNSLIFQLYSAQLSINLQEVDREYIKLKNNQTQIKKYNLSEIILNDNSKENIEVILKFIKESNFEDAVVKYSNSASAFNKGRLGWIYDHELNEKYLNTLQKMKIGEISNPIYNANQVIILKLNDLIFEVSDDLDEEIKKKEILNAMKNRKLEFFSLSHFTKVENTALIDFQ